MYVDFHKALQDNSANKTSMVIPLVFRSRVNLRLLLLLNTRFPLSTHQAQSEEAPVTYQLYRHHRFKRAKD